MDWLPGWGVKMVFSESGFNEEGCIFIAGAYLEPEAIWTTVRHDPEQGVIEFLNVSPGNFVLKFNINLAPGADGARARGIRNAK